MADNPKPWRDPARMRNALLTALHLPWRVRSLTWRILALNVLALATLLPITSILTRYLAQRGRT